MTSAAVTVTPIMRRFGWNIELFRESDGMAFAGVFQTARNNALITFRDIVDEIRLSFEFPHESSDVLSQVGFGLVDMFNVSEDECPAPKFVHGAGLDQLVPALPDPQHEVELEDRAILRYQFLKHQACTLTADQPFQCHLEAGCAQHISQPVRRVEPRYLPPKKASTDPRFATYLLRKTKRSKPSESGSMSPRQEPETDQVDKDLVNFRNSCLVFGKHCAVTHMGSSWCNTVGPALQACHIVSQLHYHTYPLPQAAADGANPHQSLEQAWERTWAPSNGIILFSHLHDMFDQRLFSIHPETLKIRVFMPYDILLAYHGLKAKVPRWVAKAALRHHYDMSCIENMAARLPFEEQQPRTAIYDGYITPNNSKQFLADVNWKLQNSARC